MLAALSGADVAVVDPRTDDPIRRLPPHVGGVSRLHAFLARGKRIVSETPTAGEAFLLTDDPEAAAAWPTARSVLIRALPPGDDGGRSELAIMARSGLLDIFGSPTAPPQPLPGHQIAYLGGLAALNALLSAHIVGLRGGRVEPSSVTLLSAALWINWKHLLAGWQGRADAGLHRSEEWTTLRCKDGFVAITFQDKDMPALAAMCDDSYFLDPALATRAGRAARIDETNAVLETWLGERTRREVAERARELRLPVGAVLSPQELLSDAQFDARAFLRLSSEGHGLPQLPVLWNRVRVGAGSEVLLASAEVHA
jgi:crotonobetainyl-CoA:carnitine CoA-transferase CaiB-like acyl-CoA transferase